MNNHLIIGYGEIGKAVGAVIGEHEWLDTDKMPIGSFEILHICFPYSDIFMDEVARYSRMFDPEHVIIYSTVPIGTTRQLMRVVHSPVEGKHPDLELSIRTMERWIGYNDKEEALFFNDFFLRCGLRTRMVENSDYTEALKLLSTAEYGINIVFAAYKARVAEEIGMDYKLAKEWNDEYNKLYKALGMEKRVQKFVLDPPQGAIGGHCVVPNAKLLNEQFPDNLLDRIINQGEEL